MKALSQYTKTVNMGVHRLLNAKNNLGINWDNLVYLNKTHFL